jgi:hypothetical protein
LCFCFELKFYTKEEQAARNQFDELDQITVTNGYKKMHLMKQTSTTTTTPTPPRFFGVKERSSQWGPLATASLSEVDVDPDQVDVTYAIYVHGRIDKVKSRHVHKTEPMA